MSAFEEWHKLYRPSAESIWKNEIPELRNAAMIVYIMGLELERIKLKSENQLNKYRQIIVSKSEATVEEVEMEPTLELKSEVFSFNKPDSKYCVKPTKDIPLNDEYIKRVTPKNVSTQSFSKKSYVSPDLFGIYSPNDKSRTEQPSTSIVKEVEGITPIEPRKNGSPKINRNDYRKFNRNKLLDMKHSKVNQIKQKNKEIIDDTKNNDTILDDVIAGTPELPKRKNRDKRIFNSLNINKENPKKTKYSNTLTQMYPQSLFNSKIIEESQNSQTKDATQIEDCEATVKDSLSIAEIINLVDKKYHVEFDPKCDNCTKWGSKCAKHKVSVTEEANETFTGFWDFTLDTAIQPEESEKF